MPSPANSYYSATRHPWPCFLFLLPLLLLYEGGVIWLGGAQQQALRNGADAWVRWALSAFGLQQMYLPPVLMGGLFLVWSWWRFWDRPADLVGTTTGMAIESVLFALGLWVISRELAPLLDMLGVQLSAADPPPAIQQSSLEQAVGQVVTYVGAGVYEEVIFRLLLFSGIEWLLRWILVPEPLTTLLGAAASSTVFSAAHHIGPFGEAWNGYVFLFRTLAGLYFAVLFRARGFGIAAGAHACYDVLVGGIVG